MRTGIRKAAKAKTTLATYFEFDVSLIDIKPKIWRRIQLPADASFGDLNQAIQDCGPWLGEHLWHFRESGRDGDVFAEFKYPGSEDNVFVWGDPAADAEDVPLNDFFAKKGDRCLYEYDFGDSWDHDVKLRKVIESDERFQRRLIAGERNFPPEDCGGVWGYYECLYALGKVEWGAHPSDRPSKADLAERRGWLGKWDPEEFDLEAVQAEFDRPKPRKKRKKGV